MRRHGRACRRHTHGRPTRLRAVRRWLSAAREAAEKALALDPQLVDAHLAMGWISSVYDWDWAAADASYRRALDLEPGNARALMNFGFQAIPWTLGRSDRRRTRPSSAIRCGRIYTNLGLVYWQPTAIRRPSPLSGKPRARSRRGYRHYGARAGPALAGQD